MATMVAILASAVWPVRAAVVEAVEAAAAAAVGEEEVVDGDEEVCSLFYSHSQVGSKS